MSTPPIEQVAAAIRKSTVRQPPESRRLDRRIAADFHQALPDVPDETIGAVLLQVAMFLTEAFQRRPQIEARELAGLLGGAGEKLYHHPATRPGPAICTAAVDGAERDGGQ